MTKTIEQEKQLSSAEIRAGIAAFDDELTIARNAENSARLRLKQAEGRVTLGHGDSRNESEALAAATAHRIDIESKRASLDALLPFAELDEMEAERTTRLTQRAADENELAELVPQVAPLEAKLEAMKTRIRSLRQRTMYTATTAIDAKIARHVQQHRAAFDAAGRTLPAFPPVVLSQAGVSA